ncbi:hypothetical protein OROHE_008590 [Orobanche hederae]
MPRFVQWNLYQMFDKKRTIESNSKIFEDMIREGMWTSKDEGRSNGEGKDTTVDGDGYVEWCAGAEFEGDIGDSRQNNEGVASGKAPICGEVFEDDKIVESGGHPMAGLEEKDLETHI